MWEVKSGALQPAASEQETIRTIGEGFGAGIGVVTAILLVAFFVHRRNGN